MPQFPEITELLQHLAAEEAAERAQHEDILSKMPLSERRKAGITWYPLQIREIYYDRAERVIMEIERPQNHEAAQLFQNGQQAVLFCNRDNDPTQRLRGTVSAVRNNQLRITLQANEPPEWLEHGKLGLDALFDEVSYREMRKTLQNVNDAQRNRLATLRDVLFGLQPPTFKPLAAPLEPAKHLNISQQQAVQQILEAQEIAIVHGPPGTGKTTTLVEAIAQCFAQKPDAKIMVCAPSNNAVDLLTAKLHEKGLKVLRLGNPARINNEILPHTLDHQTAEHPHFKLIKEYKKQAADFRNMAHKYKRNFGRDERQQRKLLFDEAYRLLQEVQKTEDYIVSNLVEKTQVVACTPVGSTHKSFENQHFDWVFIDEAAQALEPMSWIPIQKAERVILAGDHHQLPPTIKSENAAIRKALTQTLFEKAIAKHPQASSLLSIQYRMNEQIMGFSSQYFYGNKLVAAPQVAQSQLVFAEKEHAWSAPMWLVDTAGCSFDEKNIADRSGIFNPEEATLVQKLWQQLRDEWPKNQPLSVGIISPYRAQVEYLKEMFEADKNIPANIHLGVNTIDGFQGQERDVIFISLVRSNARQEIGFLSDYRRMNVAMTRARKKLVIIGDSATFAADDFYAQILKYAEDNDAYKSAWEYL